MGNGFDDGVYLVLLIEYGYSFRLPHCHLIQFFFIFSHIHTEASEKERSEEEKMHTHIERESHQNIMTLMQCLVY